MYRTYVWSDESMDWLFVGQWATREGAVGAAYGAPYRVMEGGDMDTGELVGAGCDVDQFWTD